MVLIHFRSWASFQVCKIKELIGCGGGGGDRACQSDKSSRRVGEEADSPAADSPAALINEPHPGIRRALQPIPEPRGLPTEVPSETPPLESNSSIPSSVPDARRHLTDAEMYRHVYSNPAWTAQSARSFDPRFQGRFHRLHPQQSAGVAVARNFPVEQTNRKRWV